MNNVNLDGGHLSLEQLDAVFRTIPREMGALDENDRTAWSSMDKNRPFKQTEKDISKTVFEVHSNHSQRHAKKVLNRIHTGNRKNISIVIAKDGQPISISLYSLHNEGGKYTGCIEVTQAVKSLQVRGNRSQNILSVLKRH